MEVWGQSACFTGVGGSDPTSDTRAQFAIGVNGGLCSWEAQVLDGASAHLPALMGLPSLLRVNAVIDLTSEGMGMTIDSADGRMWVPLQHAHGHLMMLVDDFPEIACDEWQEAPVQHTFHLTADAEEPCSRRLLPRRCFSTSST